MTENKENRCLMFFYSCSQYVYIKFYHRVEKSSENKTIHLKITV